MPDQVSIARARAQHRLLLAVAAVVLTWAVPKRSLAQEPTASPPPEAAPSTTTGTALEPTTPPEAPAPPSSSILTACSGQRIEKVRVGGNRRVATDDIIATIDLKPGTTCENERVASDIRRLWELGYFDDIAVEAEPGSAGLLLTILVKERPLIGAIVFEGNDEIDTDDLTEAVDLKEGTILSLLRVREQLTKIEETYASKGFFLARARYALHDMPRNEVEVRFTIDEGREVTVRHVDFIGNRNLSRDELLSVIQTSESGFFSFLSSSNRYQKEIFSNDVTRLQALYYDHGYLMVRLGNPIIALTPDRNYIDVTIPIEEGPRFRVGKVDVAEVDKDGRVVTPLAGTRLAERVDAKPGEWFSRSKIARSLQDITRFYRDHGYARVNVEPQTQLNPDTRIVDVQVAIERGPLITVERINIRGNTTTRDAVIRREIQLTEGELYNQSDLEASKSRIQALGYFERVDINESQGSTDNNIDINVEVAERPTGAFQLSAGFSTFENFVFMAQVQQQNLFGRGQSLSLQVQLSGIRQMIQLSFTEPYLFNTNWSSSVDLYKTIRRFSQFDRDTTGASLTMGHPIFTNRLRIYGTYTGEQVDISAPTSSILSRGGRGFNAFRRLPLSNLFRDGFTSSARFSLVWDGRDNRLVPTKGIYASVSSEVADPILGSDNTFIRHQAFFRYFRPLLPNVTLKLNTETGLITSRNAAGVPIFERYFLGGITNVRGFFLRTLGPRVGIPLETDPTLQAPGAGVVIGGNMQAFYNLEVEFPVVQAAGIRGVAFTDGGNTWNLEKAICSAPPAPSGDRTTDPCRVNLTDIRTSWGFGIRWYSPLGPFPLRFEWGFPFNPRSYERDVVFEFTFGNFF